MPTNVFVVVVDALRFDRVGRRSPVALTPNLDGLAREWVTFPNAFTTANTTDVAVTSIQTGRYPLSHGVLNHGYRVTDEQKRSVEAVEQLPGLLSRAGYDTAKFGRPLGRWHRKGFDVYPSEMESREAFDVEQRTMPRLGAALEWVHPGLRAVAGRSYDAAARVADRLTSDAPRREEPDEQDSVVDNVASFLEDRSGGDAPFYAFVHLMDAHAPYSGDADLVARLLAEGDYPVERVDDIAGNVPDRFHEAIDDGAYPDVESKYYRPDGNPTTAVVDAHYDAAVRRADARVGELLSLLESNELLDETLLVVLADHGESLTEHGIYYDHHGLYEVTTHVPLFVRPPGGAAGEVDDLVQITDVAPTIADYVGVEGLDADGASLRPAIEDGRPVDREFVVAEEAYAGRRRMIRTDRTKLIYALEPDTVCRICEVQHAPGVELYHLDEDGEERHNVARDDRERVEDLRELAEQAAGEFQARRPQAGGGPVEYEDDREVRERLEKLGYR